MFFFSQQNFKIDQNELHKNFKKLQQKLHPDLFVNKSKVSEVDN